MSDHGRLDMTDKIKAAVQPDSTKSYSKQAGQEIRGQADKVASAAEPEREKGIGQKIADKREFISQD